MRTLFIWICCIIVTGAAAQTTVSRTYPVKPDQKIELEFDYPKIIRISTWDKNEVSVKALVNINQGGNDTAFVLESTVADNKLSIRNQIRNVKDLPGVYTVVRGGQKIVYRSYEQYIGSFAKGDTNSYLMTSEGPEINITIEIKIPANTPTNVSARYGTVELVNFNAPATINAIYGGIDATVEPSGIGKLNAVTNYGQIFTNLDLKLTDKEERNFFTSITAEPGKGPEYILKSTYGNLYLRKR